ncbi:hypothetical protein CC85DRAFT_305464 [Cutaneotrichosporon oleaginosum]|uniref:Uncharacterized protein n=1 Tax=Cutaneotrichosporon oleaginosum TaxID=879819 RepID=A0A0J0XD40_9TREE|nr:uncharacterized protein CC85DRAFT_305464 [Cutaneotrichosporon oleaginosum]KLT38963.1 hypothetical protein CC85DRAFT_305464 [Cutaneotrichosporon oleaginosum]TXT14683.1 hypothetical protein COLE_00876 [Cutaneotrichosporon oleaginosum]
MHNPHIYLGSPLMDHRRVPNSSSASRPTSRPASPPSAPRKNLTVPTPIRPSRLNPSPPPLSPSPLPPLPNTAPAPEFPLSRESSEVGGACAPLQTPLQRGEIRHPLQDQIDRLAALCKAHEQRFRSSRSSFEHRVFSEFPSVLGRLGELDARAEKATADLYSTMNTAIPTHQKRLKDLVDEHTRNVDEMHERTTPWVGFDDVSLQKRTPARVRNRGIGKIERIRNSVGEADDLAALAKFEQMADEVEEYLQDELARLERKIDSDNFKRAVGFWTIISLLALLLVYHVGHTLWRTACRITGWCTV